LSWYTSPLESQARLLTEVQNKTIADDADKVLALQGVSWFTRKAIRLATVVVSQETVAAPARVNNN